MTKAGAANRQEGGQLSGKRDASHDQSPPSPHRVLPIQHLPIQIPPQSPTTTSKTVAPSPSHYPRPLREAAPYVKRRCRQRRVLARSDEPRPAPGQRKTNHSWFRRQEPDGEALNLRIPQETSKTDVVPPPSCTDEQNRRAVFRAGRWRRKDDLCVLKEDLGKPAQSRSVFRVQQSALSFDDRMQTIGVPHVAVPATAAMSVCRCDVDCAEQSCVFAGAELCGSIIPAGTRHAASIGSAAQR